MSLSQPMSFYSSLTVAQVFPPFIPTTHTSSLLANLIDSQGIHFLIVYVIVTKNVQETSKDKNCLLSTNTRSKDLVFSPIHCRY